MSLYTKKTSGDVKTNTTDYQKARDQFSMLWLLVLGRNQIENGKVIDHDDVVALFNAEDSTRQ